jgi:hypothetical protein
MRLGWGPRGPQDSLPIATTAGAEMRADGRAYGLVRASLYIQPVRHADTLGIFSSRLPDGSIWACLRREPEREQCMGDQVEVA